MGGNITTGVEMLYYGLGNIFMLGGAVAAYVRALQGRICKLEAMLSEDKLYVADNSVSKQLMSESKRSILDSIRDLALCIDRIIHNGRE